MTKRSRSLLSLALFLGLVLGATACGGSGGGNSPLADDDNDAVDDDNDDNDDDNDDNNDDNDNDDSSSGDDDTTNLYGACCVDVSCSITPSQDCPGVWQGADTDCLPNPCVDDDDDDDDDNDDDNDDDDDDTSPADDDDDAACDPTSCPTGCCDVTGICQPGTANGACGGNGGECAVCSADNECTDQACAANCVPGDCSTGCCDGVSCVDGTTDAECGANGAACVVCPAGQECIGLDLGGGACGCDAASCPLGCCHGDICEAGTADNLCGAGGAACEACASGIYCLSQQCLPSYALSFDGADDYVDVPDAPNLRLTGPMTVEAWVYLNSFPDTGVATIVMKGDHTGGLPDHGWRIGINGGLLQFVIMNNAANLATASGPPPVNQWVHIAGIYDGARVALWQDGALDQSTAATIALASSTADLLIGKDVNPNPFFDGLIDEVRISNVARYNAPFTPANRFAPDAHTVALWHFDENQGTTLDDASGNGHNGVVNGATWAAGH